MTLQNSIVPKARLLGIDIFRGIAAYGVILIHGLGDILRDNNALAITNFFVDFCVPFFLVTSFYFSKKILVDQDAKTYLVNRTKRIIIPYAAWSLIYFLARFAGSLIGNKESFNKLVSDPINIIFFGASGVQLYFLPMLFCGLVVAIPITKIFQNIKNNLLVLLFFFLSVGFSYLITTTGNGFILGEGIAFKHLLNISSSFSNLWIFQVVRVILVFLSWTIRCMPYIIFGIIINDSAFSGKFYNYIHILNKKKLAVRLIWFLLPLFMVVIFKKYFYFLYLLLPYISFLYAILISGIISQNPIISWIANKLGYFSFGIYLVHALITAGFLPVMVKLYPNIMRLQLSPFMLIFSSVVIFSISLGITYLISLNKTAARILLAV